MCMDGGSMKDRVCVVTGGGGVLCSAMAEGLLAEGAKVALLDLSEENLARTAEHLRGHGFEHVMTIKTDILAREDVERARDAVRRKWGPAWLLVNGAGGNSPKATTQDEYLSGFSDEDFKKGFFGLQLEGFDIVFALNFKGTLLPTLVFAEDMARARKGNIVNISSMNAFTPLTKIPAYSAAKAAVSNFTQWLAVHFSRMGVRVNAIAPGFFCTDQNRFLLYEKDGRTLTPRGEKIIAGTPLGEFGQPEDLIGALLFLAGDSSRFVTGVVLPVDGGFSAYSGV